MFMMIEINVITSKGKSVNFSDGREAFPFPRSKRLHMGFSERSLQPPQKVPLITETEMLPDGKSLYEAKGILHVKFDSLK